MKHSLEEQLATFLRSLLHRGMRLDQSTSRIMTQVLSARDVSELAFRLTDCEDAEAWSMRDLALFPDQDFALAVEAWLMEQDARSDGCELPEHGKTASLLDQAILTLHLPDQKTLQLTLDKDEARRFVSHLNLGKQLPTQIREFLADPSKRNDDLVPAIRLACRQARLSWRPVHETFVLTLLQGCFSAAPEYVLRRRALPLVKWSLEFLEHTGDDIPASLARRRDELLRNLDQAEEMERIREKYNFETRKMLGIVEQHLEPSALRDELSMVELAARATGGFPPHYQVMRRDLGEARTLEEMGRLMDLSG